ncbi:pentapeptide repeat-containing protein [Leptolyngbya ectocarpi]|uniref:pentapeptide repeat-containing protein n=1 Tax=Leptolyngbya ectocarpi TaxID=1202 RepID=UPI002AD214B7|nr:pentapeptide repeat-containing protein [Leptolyngbya ectocarpi]
MSGSQGADLRGADLNDAFMFDANLSDANLSGAKVGGRGGLDVAKLCRTTLPESFLLQVLNNNRDCEKLNIENHTR